MHIAGRAAYDFGSQSSESSGGPRDVQTVDPPAGAEAVALTIESPPIRITFDGKNPSPTHGLLLKAGDHFFPFARQMKFASAEQGRQTVVNFLWLNMRPEPRGTT
jgi:hypothetical protein